MIMNTSNIKFGEFLDITCPKCGYRYELELKEVNPSVENTHRCFICNKYFSYDVIFFAQGTNEKQQEN